MRRPVLTLIAALSSCMALESARALDAASIPEASTSREASPAPRRIVIPHDEPYLPALPGRQSFVSNCVICHSPRYVTAQPDFPRAVWEAEVKKMIKVYGARIEPQDVPAIVAYLVALNGQGEKKP